MSFESICALLARQGYELRFRIHEWVECLVVSEQESFVGRGRDRDAALWDAVRQACPTSLASRLLTEAIAREVEQPSPAPPLLSAEPSPLESAIEELDLLLDRIRDSKEELAMSAAERQRLAMLAWICEARAHAERFNADARVRERVAAVSRRLTEIGKCFWPGSVTALQLHMEPRDLPQHLLGESASTWHRALELAERALFAKDRLDHERGYDDYGWADAVLRGAAPLHSSELLDDVIGEVESLSGALEPQAPPEDPSLRPEGEQFLKWVRTLRWVRGEEVDPTRWGTLAGRLRWWVSRRDPRLGKGARELDPAFSPRSGWAKLLAELGVQTEATDPETELAPASLARPGLPESMLQLVRPLTSGKRGVLVSLRRDTALQSRLMEVFGFSALDCRIAEPRRLDALGEAIQQGEYDLVLGATGFQTHSTDNVLARACRLARVRYVRVNNGQPMVCLRALARSPS